MGDTSVGFGRKNMVPLSCPAHRSARGCSGKTTTTDHRFNIGSGSGMAVVLAGPQLAAHQGVWNDPTASWTCKGGLGLSCFSGCWMLFVMVVHVCVVCSFVCSCARLVVRSLVAFGVLHFVFGFCFWI